MDVGRRQLEEELAEVFSAWEILGDGEMEFLSQQRLDEIWDALTAGAGSSVASQLADALRAILRPGPAWWGSRLGRIVLASLGDDVPITQREAAVLLGVGRGTVSNLISRRLSGKQGLDLLADGRLSLRSVVSRLERVKGLPSLAESCIINDIEEVARTGLEVRREDHV